MKISPLFKAYIKSILFKKLDWTTVFIIFYLLLCLLNLYIGIHIKTYPSNQIFFCLTVVYLIVAGTNIFSLYYGNFKEYEYGKTKIPDDVSKIKSEVSPDVWEIIKQLDVRVEKVEKESPIRWMFISIFFTLFLTVAVSIAIYLIPKILPH